MNAMGPTYQGVTNITSEGQMNTSDGLKQAKGTKNYKSD
jgi:hypothetical protein